ncbi:hypothetical protein Fot_35136 [Forsythia ovata]|uniref:Uncharacterized protein n=1 Tax=Forsythia ovata TaxID=205694 RepID=A0ABD1SKQ3_9LAMI
MGAFAFIGIVPWSSSHMYTWILRSSYVQSPKPEACLFIASESFDWVSRSAALVMGLLCICFLGQEDWVMAHIVPQLSAIIYWAGRASCEGDLPIGEEKECRLGIEETRGRLSLKDMVDMDQPFTSVSSYPRQTTLVLTMSSQEARARQTEKKIIEPRKKTDKKPISAASFASGPQASCKRSLRDEEDLEVLEDGGLEKSKKPRTPSSKSAQNLTVTNVETSDVREHEGSSKPVENGKKSSSI